MNILSQHSESAEVTFFDDEYEYQSLAEIDESKNVKIQRIDITTRNPYSNLTVGKERLGFSFRDTNRIYVGKTDDGEALFLRIREFLKKQQRISSYFFRWWIFVASGLLNLSTMYVPWRTFLSTHIGRQVPAGIEVGTDIYQLLFMCFVWRGMSIIKLDTESESSFLSRNRDDLWKLGIAAVAGAVVTELIHALVSHFSK